MIKKFFYQALIVLQAGSFSFFIEAYSKDQGKESPSNSQSKDQTQRAEKDTSSSIDLRQVIDDRVSSDLSSAMENLSDELTREKLKGAKIPVAIEISATRTGENTQDYIIISLSRDKFLEHSFVIDLKPVGTADFQDVRSLDSHWNRVLFKKGEQLKQIELMVTDDGQEEGFEVFLMNLVAPSFVALSHDQIGFTIADNDFVAPINELAIELTSIQLGYLYDSKRKLVAKPLNFNSTPAYRDQLFQGHGGLQFDGRDDIVTVSNAEQVRQLFSHEQKTLFFIVETGDDVKRRQMIYDEGNENAGLNVYLTDGSLYVSSYNLDIEQNQELKPYFSFITNPVKPKTTYILALRIEREHGKIMAWLNGFAIGQNQSLGKISDKIEDIGVGGVYQGCRFHDQVVSEGAFFNGSIYKILQFNRSLLESEVQGVTQQFLEELHFHQRPFLRMTSRKDFYEGTDKQLKIDLHLSFPLDREVVLDPIFEGSEASFGRDFISLTNYTIPAFATKVTIDLNLTDDQLVENREVIQISFKDHPAVMQDQPYFATNIVDDEGLNPDSSPLFWWDTDSKGLHVYESQGIHWLQGRDYVGSKASTSPIFGNSLVFDGHSAFSFDQQLLFSANSSPSNQTIAMAFKAGGDLNRRQVIFEGSNQSRGLNLYIENGQLVFNVFESSDPNHRSWAMSTIEQAIVVHQPYFVIATLDSKRNQMSLYLNGKVSNLEINQSSQGLPVASFRIGGVLDQTIFADGLIASKGSHFEGEIAEFLLLNRSLSSEEIGKFFDYWERKY